MTTAEKLALHETALATANEDDRILWTTAALAFGATPEQASEAGLVTDYGLWWWMQWTGGFDSECFHTHAWNKQGANEILRNKIYTKV